MVMSIAHPAYFVKDMEASLRFYCDGLGLKKLFSLTQQDGSKWIEYVKVNDRQFIELFHDGNESEKPGDKAVGYFHLCLEVDDIQKTAQSLRDKGILIDVEPKMGIDRNWQCWVRDPDGNRIELMQFMPDCLQFQTK